MKDPLGVSPGKGNQGITRGKEKIVEKIEKVRVHVYPYFLFAAIHHLNT